MNLRENLIYYGINTQKVTSSESKIIKKCKNVISLIISESSIFGKRELVYTQIFHVRESVHAASTHA